MFNFLKKKTPPSTTHDLPARRGYASSVAGGQSTILKLQGLHCSSCATNIDLALEDLPSVVSTTSYAKSETKVSYDSTQTSLKEIKSNITSLGYVIIKD